MQAFLESLRDEKIWGQVLIKRQELGFELRHVDDRSADTSTLNSLRVTELRKLATFNSAGQFRPLRAAPDLPSGWISLCKDPAELWRAMQDLYPGSIPDWYAVFSRSAPRGERWASTITNYREFTNRQSGMYRITQFLTDPQTAQVIRACCHPRFCLKRRFWTVEGLASDPAEAKSEIPCLEPCAVLLEFARKAARIEQEDKTGVKTSELETLVAAARSLLENGQAAERAGDLALPANPRRLQLVLEKYGAAVERVQNREEE